MEAVIFLSKGALEKLRKSYGDALHVTHEVPPRLAMIEADAPTLARLRDDARVKLITAESRQINSDLTATEALFVEAWRQTACHLKSRRAEGLSWDAEGFSAP